MTRLWLALDGGYLRHESIKSRLPWKAIDQGDRYRSCPEERSACQPSPEARIAAHHLAFSSSTSPMSTTIEFANSSSFNFVWLSVYLTVDSGISSAHRGKYICPGKYQHRQMIIFPAEPSAIILGIISSITQYQRCRAFYRDRDIKTLLEGRYPAGSMRYSSLPTGNSDGIEEAITPL